MKRNRMIVLKLTFVNEMFTIGLWTERELASILKNSRKKLNQVSIETTNWDNAKN